MAPFDVGNMSNVAYLETMYETYRSNPEGVDAQWQAFFAGFELGGNGRERFGAAIAGSEETPRDDRGAISLVNAYRTWGHMVADLAPMSYRRPPYRLLELSESGFTQDDLDRHVGSGGFLGQTEGTLRDLLAKLTTTYCGTLGVEFADIPYRSQRDWLLRQMEPTLNHPKIAPPIRHRRQNPILHRFLRRRLFPMEMARDGCP